MLLVFSIDQNLLNLNTKSTGGRFYRLSSCPAGNPAAEPLCHLLQAATGLGITYFEPGSQVIEGFSHYNNLGSDW
jgi:hypothetical protein